MLDQERSKLSLAQVHNEKFFRPGEGAKVAKAKMLLGLLEKEQEETPESAHRDQECPSSQSKTPPDIMNHKVNVPNAFETNQETELTFIAKTKVNFSATTPLKTSLLRRLQHPWPKQLDRPSA